MEHRPYGVAVIVSCQAGRCHEPAQWLTLRDDVPLCREHAARWAPLEPIQAIEARMVAA